MSDEGLRRGWGGDSTRGRVGTEAKVTGLVRAWIDGAPDGRETLAIHLVGVGSLATWEVEAYLDTDEPPGSYVVELPRPAFEALEAREFRRPYKPHAKERTVYLGDGRKVTFRPRAEPLPAERPHRDDGPQIALLHVGGPIERAVRLAGGDWPTRRTAMADASLTGEYGGVAETYGVTVDTGDKR